MSREPEHACEQCRRDMPRHVREHVCYCSETCFEIGEGQFRCEDCDDGYIDLEHECPADEPGHHTRTLHHLTCACGTPPVAYRDPAGRWIVQCEHGRCDLEMVADTPTLSASIDLFRAQVHAVEHGEPVDPGDDAHDRDDYIDLRDIGSIQ